MQDGKKFIIEIEEYAKEGKPIPDAEQYKIRIDKEKYIVAVVEMTGLQLLELAGKNPPNQFSIFQKMKGGQTKKIELGETVDFRTPGIERFMTLPLDQQEG